MPLDPSDNTWWPNPWPPRTGPGGGSSYPYDWTDPFFNTRAAALGPLPSAPAPSTAAALGATAWYAPILLNNGPTSDPSNPSATTWPQQPFSLGGPFGAGSSAADPTTGAPRAPSTLGLGPRFPFEQFATPEGGLLSSDPSFRFGPLGAFPDPTSPFLGGPFGAGSSAAVPTTGAPVAPSTLGLGPKPPLAQFAPPEGGLLSSDPSYWFGLFGSDPGPTSPFAGGPLGADSSAADPMTGAPVAPETLGLGPRLPPLAPFQFPVETSAPAFDPLILASVPAATSPRSVLFDRPPELLGLGARERDLQNLDQSAQALGISQWPISKSGAPYLPQPQPPPKLPIPSLTDIARFLTPDLIDYFTKTPPPPPPFPSIPGKIPSADWNPYAAGAVGDVLNLAVIAAATILSGGEAAPLALARFTGKAGATASAEELAGLSARAMEVHAALGWIAQRMRTTAVLSTDGDTIVAGGKRDLSPKQRALLGPGEKAGKLAGAHGETTALYDALKAGLTPRALATTRPICADCRAAIEDLRGILTSKTTAIFPPLR